MPVGEEYTDIETEMMRYRRESFITIEECKTLRTGCRWGKF
jgi:hypothetical protein